MYTVTTGQSLGVFGDTSNVTGGGPETTAGLASAGVLTAFNSNGVVWGNAANQTTPYLLFYSSSQPQPVYLRERQRSGDADVPYNLVFDLTQLQNIQNNLGGNFALANNIDATGVSGFQPIGCSCTPFSGTFNGNGRSDRPI